jgi:exonuclease SbcD
MIFITDTHLKYSNIKDNISIWDQAFTYAKQHKCDIIHCGDIFDSRTSIDATVSEAFQKILLKADELGVKIVAIAGNHDKKDLDGVFSYISPFKYHPSLTLFEDVSSFVKDGVKYHLLPYFKEKGNYSENLKVAKSNIDSSLINILCTHISVESVRNNDGSEVNITNGVSLSDFSEFDKVIVGHYHNKQFFKNIYYIGSTFPHNFGEDNEKGVVLYSNDELKYLPTEFTKYITKRIEVNSVEDALKINNSDFREDNTNVKLVLVGTSSVLSAISKSSIKAKKIEFEKVEEKTKESNTIEVVHTENSRDEAFKHYCDTKKLNYEEGILCKK